MKLLILGGTVFLGRHLAAQALERGHQVTLFNRGKSNSALFPEARHLTGDRDGGLEALDGHTWDGVIDTCGYIPRVVRASTGVLKSRAAHYTFISSISVYAKDDVEGMDESDSVGVLADPSVEVVDGPRYGPLKALCEQEVSAAFGASALNIRPGLLVGPHDPSDRFTYWPARVARGGEILAPNHPEVRVQFIDVRDLAAWTLDLVEAGVGGVFNATGPEHPLALGAVLEAARTRTEVPAHVTWVSQAFLLENEVAPYTEMPLWVPSSAVGFNTVSCAAALKKGLCFRPLEETVRDTYQWHRSRGKDYALRAGLSQAGEQALLKAWHAAQS